MGEMAINFAIEELRNITDLKKNMQVLTRKIESLSNREVDVLTALQRAELVSSKKRKREVENWLNIVDEKRIQFERLSKEVGQTRTYNIVARRRLAKQVVQEIDEVAELSEKGKFPEGIVLDMVTKLESIPLVTFRAKGLAFRKNLENIWAWLMDDEVSSIGIYGMGGVGKTTLSMHLHDKLLHEPKFSNFVYWVTVSQEFNSFKLQNDIAKAMRIDVSGEDDEKKRAAILFQALSKREKFVLILDDVWKQFDAAKIGLPFRRDGCKFLVTSRFADVCQRIGCQKLMKVEPLSESEAWELFQVELGQRVDTPEIEMTAKNVARKCGGLPLGIITMARSMRGVTDVHGWKDALEQLNESCMAQDDMKSEVLPILLYSFNQLRNRKLKNCFLYCSLFPEDHPIPRDVLVCRFIAEELMDARSSRHAEFNQGHAILTELENCCLLIGCQDDEGNKCVRMHDLVREMALWITGCNPKFMVKAGLQLKKIPAAKNWKGNLYKVSLMYNEISDIPAGTSPKCVTLTTLSLKGNPLSLIPESFFVHMYSLKILDLSWTKIAQLPNSISDLGNLKSLVLSHCRRLVSLPSLKRLKELRELDVSWTNINEMIHGMESLANLKCSNFYCVSLQMIPSGALRRLSNLQRLILPLCEAVAVEEVEGLRHLEEFRGTFCSMRDLSRFVKCQQRHGKLSFYDIGVGNENSPLMWPEFMRKRLTCKRVSITRCGLKEIGAEDEIILPQDIEQLYVRYCEDMEWLVRLSSDEGLVQERRWLLLENLEELCLRELPSLMSIIKWEPPGVIGVPPTGTLCCLRELKIYKCKSITKLFPRALVENLRCLEEIYIESCDEMVEIIGDDGSIYSDTNVRLPQLRHLTLHNLPKLKSISMSTTICDSIETIWIKECKKLKKIPLFHGRQSACSVLGGVFISHKEREWWDSLEWDDCDIRNALQQLVQFQDFD